MKLLLREDFWGKTMGTKKMKKKNKQKTKKKKKNNVASRTREAQALEL